MRTLPSARLDDEDILASDALLNFHPRLAALELGQQHLCRRYAEVVADGSASWLVLCVYSLIYSCIATYSVSCGWELPPRTTMLRTMTTVVGSYSVNPQRARRGEGALCSDAQNAGNNSVPSRLWALGKLSLKNWVAWWMNGVCVDRRVEEVFNPGFSAVFLFPCRTPCHLSFRARNRCIHVCKLCTRCNLATSRILCMPCLLPRYALPRNAASNCAIVNGRMDQRTPPAELGFHVQPFPGSS